MLWLDAHLSPALAKWIVESHEIEASSLRAVGLRDALDEQIFLAARRAGATIMTKDGDFVDLLDRLGPPPAIIWLTCGNTSFAAMKLMLDAHLRAALDLCTAGEPLVEIS